MCSQEMMELTLAPHCGQSLGGNCRLSRFPESSAVGATPGPGGRGARRVVERGLRLVMSSPTRVQIGTATPARGRIPAGAGAARACPR